eukprot:CFRG4819T1
MMEVDHDPSEKSRWVAIYPAYLDSMKTIKEGRRVTKAVGAENVSPQELVESCNKLGLKGAAEKKTYSRDWGCVGRVKVQLKKSDGSLLRADIPNRKALYELVAKKIKELPRNPRTPIELPKPVTIQSASGHKGPKKPKAKMIRR